MSVLSTGQFYGETSARRETAGLAVSSLVHHVGRRLPMHVHAQPYFSMVLGGEYREESGRQSIDYEPFTIVYHPPGTAHLDEIGPGGCRFLMIEAGESMLSDFAGSSRLRSGYPTTLPKESAMLALRLLGGDGWAVDESIVHELLDLVDRPVRSSRSPGWMGEVLDRLRDEFRSPPAMGELAAEVGAHPGHVARVIRRETGLTVAQIIRRRRVDYAVGLFDSDRSLAEIALAAGFSDQAHLTRSFREVLRTTPARLRRILARHTP